VDNYLIMGVMVLLAIFGIVALCEKPRFEGAARWRYIAIGIVSAAEVVCLLMVVGAISLLLGGC